MGKVFKKCRQYDEWHTSKAIFDTAVFLFQSSSATVKSSPTFKWFSSRLAKLFSIGNNVF